MLFNSPEFIAFCVLIYALYLALPFPIQNYMLLIASYVFYGWWDCRFLFLVALSTTIDFWVGLMIESGRLRPREWISPALFLTTSAMVFLGLNPAALLNLLHGGHFDLDEFIRVPLIGWSFAGILVFIASIYFLFWFFSRLTEPARRTCCLMVSLVTQLGLLGVFKYFNFFAESLGEALDTLGIQSSSLHLNIVLPVGVSFYTFQSLSYTIDIYRRVIKPTDRFFDFALFVAYFPQLQAGPIERARQLLPQLAAPRHITLDQTSRGLYLIIFGFFKKIAIADGVSPVVDQIFATSGRVSWIDVIVGTVLFAVQIYCDFSGYTDVARGVSKLFGVNLVVNFNQPYFSTNPQDFWRRWHISLSSWLRDYLYVPLGGNRGGLAFVCRNLMITMLLGGLWHGAAWNFVLWGFYQGLTLCIYRIWIEQRNKRSSTQQLLQARAEAGHPVRHLIAAAGFFVVICYGWLLFRAHSLAQIVKFSSLLVTDFGNLNFGAGMPRLSALLGMSLLLAMEVTQYWKTDPQFYQRFSVAFRGLLIAAMIVITLTGMSNEPAQFIYFQF
jgi:alginate O-acetyltransferase complex protein AlgI